MAPVGETCIAAAPLHSNFSFEDKVEQKPSDVCVTKTRQFPIDGYRSLQVPTGKDLAERGIPLNAWLDVKHQFLV
jgi:hypothetical protein